MNAKDIERKTQALLIGLGFGLTKAAAGKFEIRNQCGKTIAAGNLDTLYYSAVYMAQDAKQNPDKYAAMNEPVNQNEMYQAGLAMSQKINQGK